MPETEIVIRGAREHNLRNVSLSLPRNRLIVMTGVSGSGKSSLAFDTLYAEGQRRYVESLSTYARQFLGQMPKPDVDAISGLAPSISIQQKSTSRNPRSTVGTITEIFDYLRVLFARVGQGYCYVSGKPIRAQSTDQIIDSILTLPAGTRFRILAPIVQNQKGEFRDLFADLLKRGFLRARVDGRIVSLSDELNLRRHHKHSIDVVIDRLSMPTADRGRLAEAVEQALRLADGRLICSIEDAAAADAADASAGWSDRLYSANYACPESGMSYEPPSPQLFSFNSPLGMCPDCNGLGKRHEFPRDSLIVDARKTIRRGAILLLPAFSRIGRWPRHLLTGAAEAIEKTVGMAPGTLLKTPWRDLPPEAQDYWLDGLGDRHVTYTWKTRGGSWKHGGTWEGWNNRLLESYRTTRNPMRRRQMEKLMQVGTCGSCNGERLNRQARHVTLTTASRRFVKRGHPAELTLPGVCALTIEDAALFFETLKLDETAQLIAEEALKEIRGRLGFLLQCGLHYLTLDRPAPTLSGGESQRIRLAGQIGCGLVGVVYILDEPSIGLHPRDNAMLLDSLRQLRDNGNTVIVVEHDEDTMRAADHIVDFGPGPGVRGGEIVVAGSVEDVRRCPRSVTGQFLSGEQSIPIPGQRRAPDRGQIVIHNARHNNLKNITVSLPLGRVIGVTGVSGSGKSSLINDILWQVVNQTVNRGNGEPGDHDAIDGLDLIDKGIDIDQSPIGRTPRSNPATYVKVFDEIRQLYARLPQSRMRGYKPGRFSFNVAGGRCESCEGHGARKLEMDFLADIWVPCAVCEGHRFSHETLEVTYRDHSIADVLELDIGQAAKLFESIPKISRLLQTLCDVGLDYMKLGQASPTLSGGEAQRIKLARELGKRTTGRTLYLLDEPTTGLHFADVRKLLEVLHGFADAGNTVVVIEHNLDVIKTADWLIDLGPDGGAGGGEIVAEGTPEDVARCRASHTGAALRHVLPGLRPRRTARRKSASRSGNGHQVFSDRIRVTGASQHNLQRVNLSIPRDRMVVFCGPSGSGKTSLAMDTLYAEGQRRYVESLSAYARQFLGQMPKPRVESIQGLSPAIAIEQKTVGATPRSTVGTVTEIYDYLRILYARLGTVFCPRCQQPARQQTTDQIVDTLLQQDAGTRLLLLAPVNITNFDAGGELWDRLQADGFLRVRVDGTTYDVSDPPNIDVLRDHHVAVVIDRVRIDPRSRGRLADSVEAALEFGDGVLQAAVADPDRPEAEWDVLRFSLHLACPDCHTCFDPPTPQQFSFNSRLGWCPACEGLGTEYGANQAMLVTGPERSLLDGAIGAWPDPAENLPFRRMLLALGRHFDLPLDVPWYRLTPAQQRLVLYGDPTQWVAIAAADDASIASHTTDAATDGANGAGQTGGSESPTEFPVAGFRFRYRGIYPTIERASRQSWSCRRALLDMAGEKDCSRCDGTRLQPEAAAVRLADLTLPQLCRMPLSEALAFLKHLRLTRPQKRIAGDLLNEAVHRLTFLVDVGLDYLTLDRGMPTLSGGESQRIRLAGQIGRSLTGVLYVLDEPTIGLHPRDNGRLLSALRRLRDLGNTVLLVEHDREVLTAADRLVDFGPGAGRLGGTVVAEGTPRQIRRMTQASLTGGYLSGTRQIPVPAERRMPRRSESDAAGERPEAPGGWLELLGASQHNLRNVDLYLPLGTFVCVTGVSGSGKSSLIMDTLARAVARRLNLAGDAPGPHRKLNGIGQLSKVVVVDQNPIGNTPASNPATYTGVFDQIRELFCRMPEARVRGYRPARFSFNRPGGRCEECEGMGQKKIEMHFLPDVWIECPACRGKRFNSETLSVRFQGCSIADVLDMPVGRALEVFRNVAKIRTPLSVLNAIGLDYLTLGQSAPTLSGGEAQRIKLAAELARPQRGRTLYLLDEPTTGLHFDDIVRLLSVLNSLVEQGNTVVVIEHNLDVIKTADWIVDIGPEAGADGGRITAEGTPEDLADSVQGNRRDYRVGPGRPLRSWTAELLAPLLTDSARGMIDTFNVEAVAESSDNDVTVEELGRAVGLPWESDGRRWHTVDRVSHHGTPCRWEGRALEFVVELLSRRKELAEVNWNHRSTVEVRSRKGLGWFLHARTGGEWLLPLCFRVAKGTFQSDELDRQLGLRPLDDMDDVPAYGREPRVKVRDMKTAWQEVTVKVHRLTEIDTPEFRAFLQEAVDAYLRQSLKEAANPHDLTPWKQLGRKWHLMRKGLPRNGRVPWATGTVESVLPVLEDVFADCDAEYGLRTKISWRRKSDGRQIAELQTKRADGVDIILLVPHDAVTLGAIAEFGDDREVTAHRDGRDAVRIRLVHPDQGANRALHAFLRSTARRAVDS